MFKFIKTKDSTNKFDTVDKIEFTIESDQLTISELKEIFRDFLRACSYSVDDEEF